MMTLGAMIATCTFASAEEKPKRPDRPKRQVPAHVLEKFDKDGDGKLSPPERTAMKEERRAKMLKKFDTDGDGKLSDDERTVMREKIKAVREAHLAKYDADKDGKLNPDEMKAAHDAGEEMPMGGGPRRHGKDKPAPPPADE